MERTKYFLLIVFSVFSFNYIIASNKLEIYNAYLSNNMHVWKQTIDKMQHTRKKQNEFILELVNYQYGYIAWCIANKKEDEARKYINLAEKNITYLEKKKYRSSLLNAYRAAFYGFRIGLNTIKAPFLGPKSMDYAKLALQQDRNNWFAYLQYGNIQYYTPSIFGGSKTDAINSYLIAKELMEKDRNLNSNNWNYLNLLTTIATAYSDISYFHTAKKYYQEILNIAPEFTWVKNELYPELIKRLN